MKKFSCLVLTALLLATCSFAFAQNNSQPMESLKALEGEWIAAGGGEPGQGSGSFSFHFDLDKKVMTRKSESTYPASGNRPAIVHKDLMVIYIASSDSLKAIYFDNEGHTISYSLSFPDKGKSIQFTSSLRPGVAAFRLTYELMGAETMNITFEISPDGYAEHFKTYLKGVSHRKA